MGTWHAMHTPDVFSDSRYMARVVVCLRMRDLVPGALSAKPSAGSFKVSKGNADMV
jgi:hypothetical protein